MSPARILVVEDDPAAARLLEGQLRAAHYQCIGAVTTGREAIRLVESARPDLVLMDIMLPGDLDGIQTAAILAERFDIPVLYLTAYPDEELFERARATSPLAYLGKPCDERELKRAIEVALDRHELLCRLQDSEAHLAEAQAVARLGSWRWDVASGRVDASGELLRLLDLEPGRFEPRFDTFYQLACAADRPRMLQAMETLLAGGDPGDVDIRLDCAEHPARVLRLRGSARFDADHKAVALTGTARDVTDEWLARREAEDIRGLLELKVAERTEELWRNEERYRGLIDNLPDAVLVMRDDRVVFANPAASLLLGFAAPAALLGASTEDLVDPEYLQDCERCKQEALTGRGSKPPTFLRMRRADGGGVDVESLTFAYEYEGQSAVLAVVHDVTYRRAIEQATERFRVALDSSPDAVCLIDPERMRFVDVNATACASLGYSREELLRLGPHDIKPRFNKTMLRRHFAEVLAGRPGAEVIQTVHQRKDGTTFPVEISLRPFESADQSLIVAVTRDITERLRTEAQLRESSERFQQLAASVSEAFWVRDLAENRFIYVSPAYENLFGKPAASLYRHPRSFLAAVHPEDHDRIAASFDQQRIDGQGVELEYRIIGPRGHARWIWVRSFPIRDAEGKVYRMAGVAQDVTERRESEEQFRSIIQTSMDGFWMTDTENHILDCNEAYCRMSGYSREELLARPISDLKFGSPEEEVRQRTGRIIERGYDRFESRHRRKDGRPLELEVSAYFRPTSEGGRLFAFLRDITERKQAERALRESEARFSTVFHASPVGIGITRIEDGYVVDLNQAMLDMFGYGRDEVLGRTTLELGIFPEPGGRGEILEQLRRHGRLRNREMGFRRKSGIVGDGLVSVEPIDLDGNPHLLTMLVDIAERRQAEERLRVSEARSRSILRAAPIGIGVLVERVFMEVNEAMTGMTGYTREELLGQSARMLYPTQEEFDYVGTEKYRQIQERGIGSVESRWRCKNGAIIDVALSSSPIVAGDFSRGMTFTAQDITATKRAEQERLVHEASQRDALVREVHHRIKNNLQGVIGLLRQHVADHPAIQPPIEAAIAQINTIAVVHGLQSRMPQHQPRLRELLGEVGGAAAALAMVAHVPPIADTLAGDVWLDSGAAVTVALILNELIHNALKHGRHAGGPEVTVELAGDSRRATIRICNPGGPLPAGFDLGSGRGCGTGLDLVRTLLPRRGAELRMRDSDGRVCAEFALSPPVIADPSPSVSA